MDEFEGLEQVQLEDEVSFDGFEEADLETGASFPGGDDVELEEPTQTEGEFEGLAAPTDQTQLGAAAEAGARSLMQGSAAVAGAGIGAAVSGPFAPVGGLIGAGIGYWVGGKSADISGFRSPEQMDPEFRSSGYFGESIGGALPFATVPYALAAANYKFAPTAVGNLMNQIVNTAKTMPGRFATVEAGTIFSSGVGAAAAEQALPGNVPARMGAELAFGFINPANLVRTSMTGANRIVSRAYQQFSPDAQETAAGRYIADLMQQAGDDPDLIARVLKEAPPPGLEGLTAAQRTDSPALSALSEYLAKQSKKYGAESEQKMLDGLDAIRSQVSLLRGTGDPAALTAAAEVQTAYYRTLIQGRLDDALNQAKVAAGQISQDNPAARAELGVTVRGLIDESITAARAAERELWAAVPKDQAVPITNLQREFDTIVADLLPEVRDQKTPKIVRDFIARVSAPAGQADQSLIILPEDIGRRVAPAGSANSVAGEMTQLRSELLDMARQASTTGDYSQARIYNNLAEATLDDIDAAFRQTNNTAYQDARRFSKELNDTYTRSFVGKATAQGRYGNRIAPELLARKATASGPEATRLQLEELEEATRFAMERGFADPADMDNMMDAQQRIVRITAADAIDPETGLVSTKKLSKFLRDNETLLNRFPEVRDDISRAVTDENYRKRMEALAKGQQDLINRQKLVGKLTGMEPVAAAKRSLLSNTTAADLTQMAKIAKRGGVNPDTGAKITPQEATDGLRASVLDAAFQLATQPGRPMNLPVARQFLFESSIPGQKSPMDVLIENGVVTTEHADEMRRFFDAADTIVNSTRSGTAIEVQPTASDFLSGMMGRIAGSKIVGLMSQASGGAGGSSIIVHGAGARMGEYVIDKIPAANLNKVLIDMMNDPQRMAKVLEAAPTPKARAEQARQINAWVIQSGFVGVESLLDLPVEYDPLQQ